MGKFEFRPTPAVVFMTGLCCGTIGIVTGILMVGVSTL